MTVCIPLSRHEPPRPVYRGDKGDRGNAFPVRSQKLRDSGNLLESLERVSRFLNFFSSFNSFPSFSLTAFTLPACQVLVKETKGDILSQADVMSMAFEVNEKR